MSDRIEKLRSIAGKRGHAVVEGVEVDAYSAGIVVSVYDKMSSKTKAKFNALPLDRLVDVALRMMNRNEMAKA